MAAVTAVAVHPRIELLWFQGCPNHEVARELLASVVAELSPGAVVKDIDASDPEVAVALRFPGSPTIRVDGVDVDPGYQDPGDYTPRCRLYRTTEGLRGVPDRRWIDDRLRTWRGEEPHGL